MTKGYFVKDAEILQRRLDWITFGYNWYNIGMSGDIESDREGSKSIIHFQAHFNGNRSDISAEQVIAKINSVEDSKPSSRKLAEVMSRRVPGYWDVMSGEFLGWARKLSMSTREILLGWILEVQMDRIGVPEEEKDELRKFNPDGETERMEKNALKVLDDVSRGSHRGIRLLYLDSKVINLPPTDRTNS